MTEKQRASFAVEALKNDYPEAICSLNYEDPLQLLIATRLSAQCTDARVNLVTPALFKKYPTVSDFAKADITDVEKLVHSCGFFKHKAADIVNMCIIIERDFGGKVPDSIDELTSLPGVGRKTANLIMGDVYGQPAIVADTHLIRITNLLGLVESKNPVVVERKLRQIIEPSESNDFCHRCVLHGRAVCVAGRPACSRCSMKNFCKSAVK